MPIVNWALNLFQAAIQDVDISRPMFERERMRNMVYSCPEEAKPQFGVKLVNLEIMKLDLKDLENKL